MNPRKADLQLWRETFAAALRDRGVEAEATPRWARGIVRKAERTPVRKLRERFERGEGPMPDTLRGALKEASGPPVMDRLWEARAKQRQAEIRRSLVVEALRLQASPTEKDQRLGADLEDFIRPFPVVATRREILARALTQERETSSASRGRGR